jgi:hypothetical protein
VRPDEFIGETITESRRIAVRRNSLDHFRAAIAAVILTTGGRKNPSDVGSYTSLGFFPFPLGKLRVRVRMTAGLTFMVNRNDDGPIFCIDVQSAKDKSPA